jgi:hypothetical protein
VQPAALTPLWFNEGLAEYYSSFSITDDQKVIVGRADQQARLPVTRQQNAPVANAVSGRFKVGLLQRVREAEHFLCGRAWALMHYLVLGKDRAAQAATRKVHRPGFRERSH